MVREHDPLCVAACGCGDCDDYCQCDLIARAKADERARLQAAVAVLHVPMWVVIDAVGGSICRECGEPVESEPCATMRAFEVFDAEG